MQERKTEGGMRALPKKNLNSFLKNEILVEYDFSLKEVYFATLGSVLTTL
jgi:hypothetical protein